MSAPYEGWEHKCHHMRPCPPPPPHLPPHGHDSYDHGCYHDCHHHPMPHELPTSGPMIGNGFMLMNYNPFIFDQTHVKYGAFINVAENVFNRITRKRDESCVNLDATFALTGPVMRNLVMQQHLEQSIGSHFDVLDGVLPIIKSDMTIRLYYTVEDDMGGVVHQGVLTTSTPYMNLHFTDVRDYFVTSLKSIFVGNIPAMEYTGMYNLILQKIEIYADTINTKEHMTGNVNPYYQFANNNSKIVVQHDTIQQEISDGSILIASEKLHEMVPFQANITTRVRISFIAFLSELICVPDTYNIWAQLFEPSDEKMDRILNEITTMKESIYLINQTLDRMNERMDTMDAQLTTNTHNIETIQTQIQNIITKYDNKTSDLEARVDDLDIRVTTLEKRPLALVRYQANKEYQPSQLVYNQYGTIYQSARAFTATTLDADVTNGNLVPLSIQGEAVIQTITEQITQLQTFETTVNQTINQLTQQIGNIESSLETVDEEVTFYDGTLPDTGKPNAIYIDQETRRPYLWNPETQAYVPIVGDIDADTIQVDVGG